MAGLIPRDFIDDLLSRTDIVELVDSRVRLKKAGRNYQACCPFHNEKSPSFTVSQDKQFYHCFGCGAHGNAISFLMEYDRLEFPEAVEELAAHHNLEVPREKGTPGQTAEQKQQKADDYELMEKVAKYFAHQLKNHANGPKAIDYLKSRGLSGEVVKKFGIGYAPSEWDAVLKTFGRTPQLQQQLLDLKLVSKNDNGRTFDFFRDRIVFPIRDRRGRVIGFGGRIMEGDGPKYLNSPETRIFHKGHELYGFYQARQAYRTLEQVVIVEGYMDVVALGQYDINYAVASLGTATTAEQLQLLFRTTSKVICCYDGDRAGRDAAWRALENALPYLKDGVELKFLFLPDGEDPDSLVRQTGKDAFEDKLSQAVPLSQFFFDNLLQRHHVTSNEGKAALATEAEGLIARIEGEKQAAMLNEELRKKIKGDSYKADLMKDIQAAQSNKPMSRVSFQSPQKASLSPLRKIIRLLLLHPRLASEFQDIDPQLLNDASINGLGLLQKLHKHCLTKPNQTTANILEYFREDSDGRHLSKLLHVDHQADDVHPERQYRDAFERLIEMQLHNRYEELRAKNELTVDEKKEFMLLVQTKSVFTVED